MKSRLLTSALFIFLILLFFELSAQRGYYDAPYKRYEADQALLSNGATVTAKSYAQANLQSEASDQVCVNMSSANAAIAFTLTDAADGIVIRYSVPDGQSAVVGLYDGNTHVTSLTLTSTWSWEYLWSNGDPNNGGVTNQIPRMRFDEVRYALPNAIANGGTLKLVRESGSPHIDFIEAEAIPQAQSAPAGAVTYTGDGSDLQSFIDVNGGKTIFLPPGMYSVNRELYFGVANTTLKGAGMWYTQIHFTSSSLNQGGLRANAANISFADLYLTTSHTSRTDGYKAINGVFTSGSTIQNIWAEHFVCGAWIGQYNVGGPAIADGFTVSNCRFRNNYADGINLCKGTSNAVVQHCSFRNNGDDDQAIWSADGLECINNTFRFNTSENCWRASGVAIYGGKNNKAHHLVIKDNLEAGIRVNNTFPGVGFNNDGMHVFYDITVTSCGTFNDLYNSPVGAIDIFSANVAGTQVKNVKLSNIDVLGSRNDAIAISKKGGDGIYNLAFENITIDGTGLEYPSNNVNNLNWGRGYFVLFAGSPNGGATYSNMHYRNRGGNATVDIETFGKGPFSWTEVEVPALSKKTLLGYWHNWGPEFRLTEIPQQYNLVAIAFALTTDHKGTLTFAPAYDAALFKQDVQTLQSQGRKVIISVGGGTGEISIDTETDKENFVQTLTAIIKEYGFDGFDIDFEGLSIARLGDVNFKNPTVPTSVNFMNAVDEVLTHFGDDLLLTAAPELYYVQSGFKGIIAEDWDAQHKLKGSFLPFLHRFHDRIDFLAVQLYNTGQETGLDNKPYDVGTADYVVAMTDMLLHGIPVGGMFQTDWTGFEWLEGFDPKQILIGLPSSASAAGNGQLSDEQLNKALDALLFADVDGMQYKNVPPEGYPTFGGLMTWSINWDRDERNYGFANNFTSYLENIATLALTNPASVSFDQVDANRANQKPFRIANYTDQEEQVSFHSLSDGLSVEETNITVPPMGSKTVMLTLSTDKTGEYTGEFTCDFTSKEDVVVSVDASIGCFVNRGIGDSFSTSLSGWSGSSQQQLSINNGRLQVAAQKTGNVWENFRYTFDEIDLSQNAVLSFDLESASSFTLRIDLVDNNGYVTNLNAFQIDYVGGSGQKHIVFDFTDRFSQSWPAAQTVDRTRIKEMQFYANPGAAFQGNLTIDNMVIGDAQRLEYTKEEEICEGTEYTFGTQTLSSAGIYREKFQSTMGCDSTVVLNLSVSANNINSTITQTNGVLTVAESGAAYQWINCAGGTIINGAITKSFSPTASGQYKVVITKDQCEATSDCFVFVITNISENSTSELSVYPNPTHGFVRVDLGSKRSGEYRILSTAGEVIASGTLHDQQYMDFQLSNSAGVYLIEVTDSNGERITARLIKQ